MRKGGKSRDFSERTAKDKLSNGGDRARASAPGDRVARETRERRAGVGGVGVGLEPLREQRAASGRRPLASRMSAMTSRGSTVPS